IPYTVSIPYAVLELEQDKVISLREKPNYTYYSNGGIYLLKKEATKLIPDNKFFNATDLIELLISMGKKVISFPLLGYWLDIGKPEDFKKAQEDFKHIKF
ncbi:MAG: sugar phosphate nucleotidyltransferase, partial [Bacteroidota bacterium]